MASLGTTVGPITGITSQVESVGFGGDLHFRCTSESHVDLYPSSPYNSDRGFSLSDERKHIYTQRQSKMLIPSNSAKTVLRVTVPKRFENSTEREAYRY
jgi:hypothetical protein